MDWKDKNLLFTKEKKVWRKKGSNDDLNHTSSSVTLVIIIYDLTYDGSNKINSEIHRNMSSASLKTDSVKPSFSFIVMTPNTLKFKLVESASRIKAQTATFYQLKKRECVVVKSRTLWNLLILWCFSCSLFKSFSWCLSHMNKKTRLRRILTTGVFCLRDVTCAAELMSKG